MRPTSQSRPSGWKSPVGESYYAANGAREANIRSRAFATRDREPWTDTDDEVLRDYWLTHPKETRDEAGIAKLLERTIEACRIRAHKLQNPEGRTFLVYRKVTEEHYIGCDDDPEDRWWDPPRDART